MMAVMNDEDFVNLKYDVERHEGDLVRNAVEAYRRTQGRYWRLKEA